MKTASEQLDALNEILDESVIRIIVSKYRTRQTIHMIYGKENDKQF